MNVAGLRQRILMRIGTDSTDQGVPVNLLNDFINDANLQIADEHDWPWRIVSTTFSTAAGTGTYTLPADFLRTRSLKIASSRPMRQANLLEMDTRWYDDNVTGEPVDYAIEGVELLLRPVPSAIFSVRHRYLKIEPSLTKDTDSPLMPEQFQTSIVELASVLAFRRLGNPESAALSQAAYETWMRKMHDKVRRSRQTVRPTVLNTDWANV